MVKSDILVYLLEHDFKDAPPTFQKIYRSNHQHSTMFIRKYIQVFRDNGLLTIAKDGRKCMISLTEQGIQIARTCRELKKFEVL